MTKRKKKLSAILLGAILALGVGAGLGASRVETGNAEALSVVALTFPDDNKNSNKVSTYTDTKTYKKGTYEWSIANFNNNNWISDWTFIRAGRKNNTSTATIATSKAISQAISSVKVTVDSVVSDKVNSTSLIIASNSGFTANVTTITGPTVATGEMVYNIPNPSANYFYKLSYDLKSHSGNGFLQISKVNYLYEEGGGGTVDPDPATQVNVTAAGGATTVGVGGSLQLSASVLPASAVQTVTWSSSNTSYAAVNSSTGLVTGVAEGSVTITATSTTPSIVGTISLTVVESGGPIVTDGYAAQIKKSNSTAYSTEFADGDVLEIGTGNGEISVTNSGTATITTTFHKNNSATSTIMNNSSGEIRLYPNNYNGGEIKLSIAGEFLFSKVTLSLGANGGTEINGVAVTGSSPESVLNPLSNTVSIKNVSKEISGSANQVQIKSITVEYVEPAPTKALTSIAVTTQPTNNEYFAGDVFDGAGMVVKAYFDDESSETITPVLPTTPLTADQTSVEISYTYKTVTKTTTVPITVTSRSITGIEVTTNPSKMTYRVGDVFDPTGMVVKATYDLGPAVDNYTNYTFTPTAAFGAVGKTNVTIVSSDDSSKLTMLEVNVLEALAEGTYTIESNASGYMGTWSPSDLNIEKSEPSMGNLVFSNVDNVKLNAGPVTGPSFCFGGTSAAGKFTITLPDGMVATAVTFDGLSVGADATTPTLKINDGVSLTYSPSITSETLHPFANSLEISSFGSSRIWTSSIEIKASFNAAAAAQSFGALFTEKTSEECAKVYGKDGNTFKVSIWNEMKLIYEKADKNVQDSIKLGEPDVEGNDLEKAIATYVYIVNKYKYVDFIGIVNPSGTKDVLFEMNENNTIMLIVMVSLIGVTALGGVFYFRKKEQN